MLTLQRFYRNGVPGPLHLLAEGVFVAVIGAGFATMLFPAEASIVCIFLASISSTDSVERILRDNRAAIFQRGTRPGRANLVLTGRMLALFLGTLVGFSAIGLSGDPGRVAEVFSHQVGDYVGQSFPSMVFGDMQSLFLHNLYVLIFFFVIALPFRQGGVMLAVAWNASVWGTTFGVLARRWAADGGPGLAQAWLRVVAACLPHMLLEAVAYVLAGLGGVFLSKAFTAHAVDSDPMASIIRTVVVMLLLAAILLAVAALLEAHLAPVLVSLLAS